MIISAREIKFFLLKIAKSTQILTKFGVQKIRIEVVACAEKPKSIRKTGKVGFEGWTEREVPV